MSEFFGKTEKILLSECLGSKMYDQKRKAVEYIYRCLGDVVVTTDWLDAMVESLLTYSSSNRYDVSSDPDTIKGLYHFHLLYPDLTRKAISILSSTYIKDLFDKYDLELVFESYIEQYGKSDDTFDRFMLYVSEKADELQKEYEEDVKKLDIYAKDYHIPGYSEPYQYITYLKRLVLKHHISAESLILSMPKPELIVKDAYHLQTLAYRYDCFMGLGYPVSYLMTRELAKTKDLSKYGEIPSYYVSARGVSEPATFTTLEFTDSVTKTKKYIL